MTGMAAKKLRRTLAKRFDSNGLPWDARDWTEADWQDLWEAMQRVIRSVSERHKAARPATEESPDA
jgi:sugar (pentulose or hexulose) kinase